MKDTTYTKRDLHDFARRTKVLIELQTASAALENARTDVQIDDIKDHGATWLGKLERLQREIGELAESIDLDEYPAA